jgi:hypothetical protein
MIQRIITFLAALSFFGAMYGQSVENIRAEVQNDKIRITYMITGATESQLFHVTLTCSMNGGSRFEPRSVVGDVGYNIQGGRPAYVIVWDVFKDLEEVGNAEFFVKVELTRDLDEVTTPGPVAEGQPIREADPIYLHEQNPLESTSKFPFQRRAYFSYMGSISSPIGLSVGMLNNWGFYSSFRFGGYTGDWIRNIWFTATAGATKYITGKERMRLYGYAGLGISGESYEDSFFDTRWTDSYFTVETGLHGVLGWFNLTLGVEYLTVYGADLVFGIGIIF